METITDFLLLIAKTYYLFLAVFTLYFSLFFKHIHFYRLSAYLYVKSINYAKKAIE